MGGTARFRSLALAPRITAFPEIFCTRVPPNRRPAGIQSQSCDFSRTDWKRRAERNSASIRKATAVGNDVLTGGWKTRSRIWVNRIQNGAEVGSFEPGPTVGGVENTGWIDLLTGVNAFRRSTGEYLVFVEENYEAKSLI